MGSSGTRSLCRSNRRCSVSIVSWDANLPQEQGDMNSIDVLSLFSHVHDCLQLSYSLMSTRAATRYLISAFPSSANIHHDKEGAHWISPPASSAGWLRMSTLVHCADALMRSRGPRLQRAPTPETRLPGPKKETKYRSTPYSPQWSVRAPKLCPGTTLGVLGKLREP